MGPSRNRPSRSATAFALRLCGLLLVGALAGLIVAVLTPAHVEIAGSDARIWLQFGRDYDQFGVDKVIVAKRATTRAVIGEPIGVRAELELDPSTLTDSSGQFNTNVLPAYIQAYSDPQQLIHNIRWAIVKHLLILAVVGGGIFVLGGCAVRGYRVWRRRYDTAHFAGARVVTAARRYYAPERAFTRHAAVAIVLLAVIATIPSGISRPHKPTKITGSPLFAGTPLDGIQVAGLLSPAVSAVRDYIETYFDQTNEYYDELQAKLEKYLVDNPAELPTGADDDSVAQVGFVTDRHCNTGMDRVVVALLKHFKVHTLVSGGDDAFSGTFGFESACTRNLADKTKAAHITDVFVGGNHDSPMTIEDEAHQGIKTLTGKPVSAGGLTFIGLPDPRTSRYGQGIVPAGRAAQDALLQTQGTTVGETACIAPGPMIAVLHDPLAGTTAMQHGCGHITVALDGHTHGQSGPTAVPLPDGKTGYQFTGASTGGAPGEGAVERTFASRLTVGPLNHNASINIASIDRKTGALVGMIEYHFTPAQDISVTQQVLTS